MSAETRICGTCGVCFVGADPRFCPVCHAKAHAQASPFDMDAPMDAPIRAREAQERRKHEAAMAAYQTPEFQAAVKQIVLDAMLAVKRRGPHKGKPR
jgi:hypothetical protein